MITEKLFLKHYRYVDLKKNPEVLASLPELQGWPELEGFLRALLQELPLSYYSPLVHPSPSGKHPLEE